MLECVVNISEGRDADVLRTLAGAAGSVLLDRHADPHHNRSVFTLAGGDVVSAAENLARSAVNSLDLRHHRGVHPRLGVVDVVPFVPIGVPIGDEMDLSEALDARDQFARFASRELGLPCFLYGPERSLPEIRRNAFSTLDPEFGPGTSDPRSGAVCVGARLPLIAYNLVLASPDLDLAKRIAKSIRSTQVRALGLEVGGRVQVSCNLIRPWEFGADACYDLVESFADIDHAELVGLIAKELLDKISPERHGDLDLSDAQTIEARLVAIR